MKSQLANRIFRTVVMSGAMLATPLAAQAEQVPPQRLQAKAPEAKPDTWDSVNKLIEANTKKLDKAIAGYIKARKDLTAKKKTATPEAVVAAQATIEETAKERADLAMRLTKTTRPTPLNEAAMPKVGKAETDLADAETKLFASIKTEEPGAADYAKNTQAIEAANKSRVAAVAKVKTERAKANKRPRAPLVDRPMGRGFILS